MDRLNRFREASRFAVFYGQGREEDLSAFEFIIVEPKGQSSKGLDYMRRKNTLVIAYLSIMELPLWDEKNKHLTQEDYLNQDGLIDLRSQRWVKMLFHQASFLLQYVGYDGLFLDTVGYVEDPKLQQNLRRELVEAASIIIYKIRSFFPEHILIQNGGLTSLYAYTIPYIDGICWENPLFEKGSETLSHIIAENLKIMQENNKLKVLILVEEALLRNGIELTNQTVGAAKQLAQKNSFLYYQAPCNYQKRINAPYCFV